MTVLFNPQGGESAHGQVIFTVSDAHAADPATYPNYKYVLEIYDGATRIGPPLKVAPRPDDNIGFFDVGPIVRNYLSVQLNPTPDVLFAQNLGEGEFVATFTYKFGEEYGFTLYPNVYDYGIVALYNYYTGRITNNPRPLLPYADTPATSGPTSRTVRMEDKFCFLPYFNDGGGDVDLIISIYDTDDIHGLATATYNTGIAGEVGMNIFNLSPIALNAIGADQITSATRAYSVEFVDAGQVFTFLTACEPKYTPYNLHFWNQWGGPETFPFRKVSRKTQTLERKTFTQPAFRIDSSGVVSYANTNGVLHDQRTTYARTFKEALKVNSDWITDEQYTWLKQLIASPIVYLDDNSGYLIPVTIMEDSYEEKKNVNDKLTALSFTLDFGQTHSTQFR